MKNQDHVIANSKTSRFECLHCGNFHVFVLPMDLKKFTASGKMFAKLHKDCIKP